ncbi:unnamed protein product [Ectocarpus fasciculatus]
MRRLETALQRYAWGKSGSESMVAQLKQSEDSDFDVDEGQTYAELWMGTHPNGPSRVMRDGHEGTDELQGLYGSAEGPGMFLIELLETYPHFLGDQEHVGDLPFMFKVLSINKALSIQAHPDKKLAERLYATRPDLYKDDNHKPEMAVALSDFEGLCGFRPFREIGKYPVYSLEIYPELRAMVGAEATAQAFACTSGVREHEENALRVLFRAFVTANTDVVTAQVSNLVERLKSEFCHGPAGKLCNETNRSNGNDGTYVVDVDCDGHGHSRGGSGGGGCSTSSTSSIDNDDDGLSAWRGKSPSFANRVSSSVPARHRNFGAICEDGEDSDMVAAEIQQEEGLRGAGGKLDGDRSGLEKAEMDIVHVRGDGDSEDLKNEEMQMLNVADGASDGTAETADGVTDNEDINTEEDDSSQSHRRPRPDGHDRASDLSSSNNSSTSNISTIHISNSNNSSISISSDCSSDNSSSSGHASGNHGVHGVATISSTEKGQLASSMRHNAAAAAAVGGGIPSCAFRRRGWSSSILAFSDVTGQRRAKEDLALRELILRLAEEYPGDIGIMMPLLLNYLRMGEGESFFMAANEPHAYLKGDILEVMARSDNVVRVALTPKHRDVPLLCQILTYNMGAPPIVTPIQVDQFCSRYTPPIKDFEMLDIQVPHGQEYATPPAPVAALAIVMAGTGFARAGNGRQKLCRGRAFFVPAGTTVVYTNSSVAGEAAALWVCLARSNINYAEGCEES